jgi:hypothetical protein
MRHPLLAWLIAGAASFIAGCLVLGNAGQTRRLTSLLAQSQADREALCLANVAFLERQTRTTEVLGPPTNSSSSISEEAIRTSLEMNVRSRKGEYILQFERPTDRKVMESAVEAFAARMASNNTPGLSNMFSKLGVSTEHSRLLVDHAHKIMVASLQAEEAISQVLRARVEYDHRLRSILSNDAYAQYRQFEALKPALREYLLFEGFAAQNKVALDPAYRAQVVSYIQQAQAYTELTFHGPYDPLTPVAVGQEMVMNGLTKQMNQLIEAANLVKGQTSEAHLPESYAHLLEAYYARSIQKLRDEIVALSDPTFGRLHWKEKTDAQVPNPEAFSFLPEETATNWAIERLPQHISDSTDQVKAPRNR